jgi:excisionase family DNA binding protein
MLQCTILGIRTFSKVAMPKLKSKRRAAKPGKPARAVASQVDAQPERGQTVYLTPTEVAERLLVATVTVRLWASKGLLPSVTTLGGHRRFRADDVDNFVARHQKTSKPKPVRATRVLIIGDDLQYSRYLSGMLVTHASNVVVEVAHDGFSAGLKCATIQPDVVTLDLQMQDMNGFEVCSKMRSLFGRAKPRIVALTAVASAGHIEQSLAAGADVCLEKTIAAEALIEQMGITRVRGLG